MRSRVALLVLLGASALALAGECAAAGSANVAALQTALRQKGLYAETIDGLVGPATRAAVRALQRRAGLPVDGVVGPGTRRALGRLGRPRLGSRVVARGAHGFDVAALQFLLSWHGFPSGAVDGSLGARTESALLRYQRWARLVPDGRAGTATLTSLRRGPSHSPLALAWPVAGELSSRFGPRGARFHAGADLAAAHGTPVLASASGRVVYADWRAGGWGMLVTVSHGRGVRTMYAHLARIIVRVGDRVAAGTTIGLVGSTGRSSGPHLHFEVRVRGAAVDPLTGLP